MTEIFQQLLDWIAQHPSQAGLVIFLVSLAESLALIGILVPGVIILFGAGTLIGSGVLNFWVCCLWAIAGAIIGDGLSYWLGHHFETVTERWRWFRLHPEQLDKGIKFFENYGDISIALGRFFGPIRAVIPLIAGLMRMPPVRFYTANILSALVWAPAYLLPGVLVGSATSTDNWLQFGIPLAAVTILVLGWWLIKGHRKQSSTTDEGLK